MNVEKQPENNKNVTCQENKNFSIKLFEKYRKTIIIFWGLVVVMINTKIYKLKY